jgi:NitT/TauT family transport system ATP-binding protein
VLRAGVSFDLKRGGILRVSGPNGSGKSTLLRTLIRSGSERSPEVLFGIPFDLGRTVSYVPQNANETLLPWLNCADNVMIGLANSEVVRMSSEFEQLASTFLGEDVHGRLGDALRHYKWGVETPSLSGGERQKLAILRGAVCSPTLLLLDEPFAELDREAVDALVEFLRRFAVGRGIALVTHQEVDLDYCGEVSL